MLTPLAGIGLATAMLLAMIFHISRGEVGALPLPLVLAGLAAFVALGARSEGSHRTAVTLPGSTPRSSTGSARRVSCPHSVEGNMSRRALQIVIALLGLIPLAAGLLGLLGALRIRATGVACRR
jgi:hypothetical protein